MANFSLNPQKMQKMLQEAMGKLQEEVAQATAEGSAGNGMVKVTANGSSEILSVKIDPSVVDPGDVEMLEDLITVAVNDAVKKVQAVVAEKTSKLTSGLGLPPGLF